MFSSTDGKLKCLPIIWNKFSQWNNTNTVHVDDLERNFQLNKSCGIVISPYNREDAGVTSSSASASSISSSGDIELLLLARYLVEISDVPGPSDLEANVHRDWRGKMSSKILTEKSPQPFTALSSSLPSVASSSFGGGGGGGGAEPKGKVDEESILRQIITSSTRNKQFFIDVINNLLQNI